MRGGFLPFRLGKRVLRQRLGHKKDVSSYDGGHEDTSCHVMRTPLARVFPVVFTLRWGGWSALSSLSGRGKYYL